jgi:hypothetical protein
MCITSGEFLLALEEVAQNMKFRDDKTKNPDQKIEPDQRR